METVKKDSAEEWVEYLRDIYEPAVMLDSHSEDELIERYTKAAEMFSEFVHNLKVMKKQQSELDKKNKLDSK